jgi:hypothetical protein
MLIGLALLLAFATVPLAGGSLGALADVRMRHGWLLAAAIALQVLIINILPTTSGVPHHAIHLASYGLVAVFVTVNRGLPFLWLIALGGALNLIAIAANGGVMPADPHALAAAGLQQDASAFTNSTAVAGAHVTYLGDVFAVPASWPVSNVFSVGDVVIVLGAFLALHAVSGSRLALWPGRRSDPVEA